MAGLQPVCEDTSSFGLRILGWLARDPFGDAATRTAPSLAASSSRPVVTPRPRLRAPDLTPTEVSVG
jgi:hypothetical protein